MDKTIKQIADELGIDKQKVYRYIKKNCITEAHQDASTKWFDEAAQKRIKSHFSENEVHHEAHQNHINDAVYEALLKQIEVKDKQIEELHRLLDQAQQLQAMAEHKLQLIEEKAEPPKRWQFWKKKEV